MRFTQVYDYGGNPYLVRVDSDGHPLQQDLDDQQLKEYTEIPPPSHVYPPRNFNGVEWVGLDKQEWEDYQIGQYVPETPSYVELLKKTVANLTEQITNLRTDNQQLSQRIAELENYHVEPVVAEEVPPSDEQSLS